MNSISRRIADELGIREQQVNATVALLDEGATVPFIARYRKEITGSLDDSQLRNLEERLRYLRELDDRRATILKSIEEQGKLTDELKASINEADTKNRLEDLYLPYKPKRRTKAQIAREAGLEPLADALYDDPTQDPEATAEAYLNKEAGVDDTKAALDGARYILMERFAEDAELLGSLRDFIWQEGQLKVSVVEGKENEGAKFRDYFDHVEPLKKVPSHRALAILRGRNEGILAYSIVVGDGEDDRRAPHPAEQRIAARWNIRDNGRAADKWLSEVVRWTWRVKLSTQIETDLMAQVREAAETEAINVFAANLKDLLLLAPAGPRPTLGLDPGLRTGVKVAVIDGTGQVQGHGAIFPHAPQNQWDRSIEQLAAWCREYKIELVAIGNGTASRETEKLVADLCKRYPELKLARIVVSESGASVYSASEFASRELPDLDVTIRGAVSIARRLQDPLAELVKIEPKSIGVGQYQHDVSQVQLSRSLDAVVEDCVNGVGVDLNTASAPLLARVSGLNQTIAQNIIEYRNQNGLFRNRKQLLKVTRLGDRTLAGGGLFAHCRWREPAGPLLGAPGGLRRGGSDRKAQQSQGGRHYWRFRVPAWSESTGLRNRTVRLANHQGHYLGTGETWPGSAAGVPVRQFRRGCGNPQRPEAGHGAGRFGHQRDQLRCLRGHRRSPGWAGAYLGSVPHVCERPEGSGQGRGYRQGKGHGRGHSPQADCPEYAYG